MGRSRLFECAFAALLATRRRSSLYGAVRRKEKAPLCNIKLHAARFGVCVGLAALVGVLSGVGGKPLL